MTQLPHSVVSHSTECLQVRWVTVNSFREIRYRRDCCKKKHNYISERIYIKSESCVVNKISCIPDVLHQTQGHFHEGSAAPQQFFLHWFHTGSGGDLPLSDGDKTVIKEPDRKCLDSIEHTILFLSEETRAHKEYSGN